MKLQDIEKTLADIAQLKRDIEEMKELQDYLQDQVKAYMQEHETDTLIAGGHKATYKPVVSNRLDSKALKADMPEVYTSYCKPVNSMRFTAV